MPVPFQDLLGARMQQLLVPLDVERVAALFAHFVDRLKDILSCSNCEMRKWRTPTYATAAFLCFPVGR
jgi:hypothetical protein